jgi:DNA-directed RNA polymerase subunit F
MTEEEKIVDFATVRDLLKGAQERRRDLTYEQRAALFHAEWAASENRNGYPTDSAVFEELKAAIAEVPAFEKYPELAAKLAELMPMTELEIKAVMASRRASIDDGDVKTVLELVRQHIGVE